MSNWPADTVVVVQDPNTQHVVFSGLHNELRTKCFAPNTYTLRVMHMKYLFTELTMNVEDKISLDAVPMVEDYYYETTPLDRLAYEIQEFTA